MIFNRNVRQLTSIVTGRKVCQLVWRCDGHGGGVRGCGEV